MEVHPPEHGIHTWRDFLVHMGTITLGLLIALGLEGLVEQAHHRHLLHTAEDNLRDELKENRAVLATDQRSLAATQAHLEQMVAALDAARAHRPGPPDPSLSWEWNGPQSAAWDTARNSGAITLMEYKQASGFALVYEQQRIVNEQAALYVRDLYSIGVTVQRNTALSSMGDASLAAMAANTQHTLADLKLLQDYCRNLDRIYTSADAL